MDKGYVYHGGGIYWAKKKQRWLPEVERVAGVRFVGSPHFLEGYRYRNCKIVLFDYEKEQKGSRELLFCDK